MSRTQEAKCGRKWPSSQQVVAWRPVERRAKVEAHKRTAATVAKAMNVAKGEAKVQLAAEATAVTKLDKEPKEKAKKANYNTIRDMKAAMDKVRHKQGDEIVKAQQKTMHLEAHLKNMH